MAKDDKNSPTRASREHRQEVGQGATGDRTASDRDKNGVGEVVGLGGTGGSSGTGGNREEIEEQGEVSSIRGTHGSLNIDENGDDHRRALESPEARRAGKTRQQEIDEQNR